MYKIFVEGELIGFCDEPHYIYKKPSSGSYVKTDEENATGIAFKGNPYNLNTKSELLDEGLPTAGIMEVDGGEILIEEIGKSEEKTETALCEIDEDVEDLKDALCEIDAQLNGGN